MSNKRVDRLEVGAEFPKAPNDEVVWIDTEENTINRYNESNDSWVSVGGTGGAADTGDITFNGVQIIGDSTMELLPDATIQTDQYLVIEPTGPNHIHVRTGGTIDESAADLYLGGERNNVFVSDTNSYVGISTKQLESVYTYWNFNTSSNTEFIADNENPILLGSIVNINGVKYVVDSVTDNQPSEGKQTITASGYIFPTGTTTTFYYFSPNNNYNWYFGSNGYLSGPAMGSLFALGITNGLNDLWLGSNTNVVLSPGSESSVFVGDTSNPDNQVATIGDIELASSGSLFSGDIQVDGQINLLTPASAAYITGYYDSMFGGNVLSIRSDYNVSIVGQSESEAGILNLAPLQASLIATGEDAVAEIRSYGVVKLSGEDGVYVGEHPLTPDKEVATIGDLPSGATGSFTSQDNKTITVTNGIITSIV
jgi:hypothetical protein